MGWPGGRTSSCSLTSSWCRKWLPCSLSTLAVPQHDSGRFTIGPLEDQAEMHLTCLTPKSFPYNRFGLSGQVSGA